MFKAPYSPCSLAGNVYTVQILKRMAIRYK